jgi:hypothetical protein
MCTWGNEAARHRGLKRPHNDQGLVPDEGKICPLRNQKIRIFQTLKRVRGLRLTVKLGDSPKESLDNREPESPKSAGTY